MRRGIRGSVSIRQLQGKRDSAEMPSPLRHRSSGKCHFADPGRRRSPVTGCPRCGGAPYHHRQESRLVAGSHFRVNAQRLRRVELKVAAHADRDCCAPSRLRAMAPGIRCRPAPPIMSAATAGATGSNGTLPRFHRGIMRHLPKLGLLRPPSLDKRGDKGSPADGHRHRPSGTARDGVTTKLRGSRAQGTDASGYLRELVYLASQAA